MGLPISYLENVLHSTSSKPGMPAIIDDYIIQIGDELVTIKELIDFWKVGHKKIQSVLDITKKYLGGNSERKPEEESKVSSEQKVETVCTSSISKPKRTRRNNKVKAEKV